MSQLAAVTRVSSCPQLPLPLPLFEPLSVLEPRPFLMICMHQQFGEQLAADQGGLFMSLNGCLLSSNNIIITDRLTPDL